MNQVQVRGALGTFKVLVGLIVGMFAVNGCESSTTNGASSCKTGDEKCACYGNGSCNPGLVCMSNICVAPSGTPSAGATGSVPNWTSNAAGAGDTLPPEAGGAPSVVLPGVAGALITLPPAAGGSPAVVQPGAAGAAVTTNPVVQSGGAATAAAGNSSVAPATGGAAPAAGGATQAAGGATQGSGGAAMPTSGGAPTAAGGSAPAAGGATTAAGGTTSAAGGSAPASGGAPVVSNVIDDFSTCDKDINNASGRSGTWYSFADDDLNLTMGVGDPGTKWADHSCGLYVTAGCSVESTSYCEWGGAGFELASGRTYDLSSYTGVRVTLESDSKIYFILKTCTSSSCSTKYQHAAWISVGTGSSSHSIPFSSLQPVSTASTPSGSSPNLANATEMQFTIGRALTIAGGGFGMAVHKIELY